MRVSCVSSEGIKGDYALTGLSILETVLVAFSRSIGQSICESICGEFLEKVTKLWTNLRPVNVRNPTEIGAK